MNTNAGSRRVDHEGARYAQGKLVEIVHEMACSGASLADRLIDALQTFLPREEDMPTKASLAHCRELWALCSWRPNDETGSIDATIRASSVEQCEKIARLICELHSDLTSWVESLRDEPRCPKCHGDGTLLEYGEPADMPEDLRVLAGCAVELGVSPRFVCLACEATWGVVEEEE